MNLSHGGQNRKHNTTDFSGKIPGEPGCHYEYMPNGGPLAAAIITGS